MSDKRPLQVNPGDLKAICDAVEQGGDDLWLLERLAELSLGSNDRRNSSAGAAIKHLEGQAS